MGYETDTDHFPDEARPHLTPDDPRSSASPSNNFHIHGSIDNQSIFNAATGECEPFNK